MYRQGHIGISLILYLPLAYHLIHSGNLLLTGFGVIAMLATTMLPDIDHQIPMLPHRGVTHSVWFAGGVGYAVYRICTDLLAIIQVATSESAAVFLGTMAGYGIISHLVADALTPMGVQPLTPFLSARWTFNLAQSSNALVNKSLLIAGLLLSAGVLAFTPPIQ